MAPIDANFYSRKRYLVVLLMFLGIALSTILKSNLSIVLMDIAYPKYVSQENRTIYQKPLVNWSSREVGFIIGAITYGLVPGILVSGIFAKAYGGATLFGCGLFASSLFACLTPAVIHSSYFWLFIIVRIAEGLVAGFIDGSYCEICLNWSPIKERARYINCLPISGGIGIILSNIVTGYGIHYFNWKTVFFATGGTGMIFSILWLLIVRNRPCDDKFMSNVERRFLEAETNLPCDKDLNIRSYPWKEIFTSKPVWAYMNEWFCCGWSASFVEYCLPFYIKDVTKLDVKNVAVMSSIPITCSILSEFIFSFIHDRMRSCRKIKNSNIHRFILSSAHLGVAVSLITMALWVNFHASLILISFIRVLLGVKYVYYNVMAIDVFYRYGGLIRSLASMCIAAASCLTPLVVGSIVTNHERSQWSLFFGLIVVFSVFSIFVFNLYGSFELQSWASVPVDIEEKPCSSHIATIKSEQTESIS